MFGSAHEWSDVWNGPKLAEERKSEELVERNGACSQDAMLV